MPLYTHITYKKFTHMSENRNKEPQVAMALGDRIEPQVAMALGGRIEPQVAMALGGRIEPQVPLGNTGPPKVGLQGALLTPLLPTSPFSPTDSKGRNCERLQKLAIATLVAALVVALQQAFDRLIKWFREYGRRSFYFKSTHTKNTMFAHRKMTDNEYTTLQNAKITATVTYTDQLDSSVAIACHVIAECIVQLDAAIEAHRLGAGDGAITQAQQIVAIQRAQARYDTGRQREKLRMRQAMIAAETIWQGAMNRARQLPGADNMPQTWFYTRL